MTNSAGTKLFYKFTIPDDWELEQLSNLGVAFTGLSGKTKDDFGSGKPYIPYVNIFNNATITDGQFDLVNILPNEKQSTVKQGDLLFTTSSETPEEVGMCSTYDGHEEELYLNSFCFGFRPNDPKAISSAFIAILFRSQIGRRITYKLAQGATRYNISKTNLLKEDFPFPSVPEQKAIAHALGLVDSAINHNNQLVAQKELRKKWLMQNLLTGKKRLKGFSGAWEVKQLGAVAHESAARNNTLMNAEALMAVTKSSGIIPMRERVQGENVKRCKVIEKDSFAYNPMRLNIGSIARWTESKRAMVSGDYVVFRCDETKLDPNYLDFFRKTNIWTSFVERAGDGSVRVRIYFSHLKHLKLKLPPLPEQTAIAQVLQAADKEIQLLKIKTEKLLEQKTGMMQQLLTGKKRLNF